MTERNQPLTFNVHIIDLATDKEEKEMQFNIRKAPRAKKVFVDKHGDRLSDVDHKQVEMLEKKFKALTDLIIWAMNNGKELQIVNVKNEEK